VCGESRMHGANRGKSPSLNRQRLTYRYAFMKQKQKKQAEKEALDPDANYTEDKGDFEIPMEDEPEEPGEEDNAEE